MDITVEIKMEYTVPKLLLGQVAITGPYINLNSRGNFSSYGIEAKFSELGFYKILKSSEKPALRGKLEAILQNWEEKYRRHLDKLQAQNREQQVNDMNGNATGALKGLKKILAHTLDVDDTVDWNMLKRKDPFQIDPSQYSPNGVKPDFIGFNSDGWPTDFKRLPLPEKPKFEQVNNEYGLFSRLFRKNAIKEDFNKKIGTWKCHVEDTNQNNKKREKLFEEIRFCFRENKEFFEEEKRKHNEAIETLKAQYSDLDPKAIEEYCELVLNNSEYPDSFPKNWQLEYREEGRMLVVEYDLPSPDHLPTVESYKYIKTSNEISEKHLSQVEQKKIFDQVVYQICIRTIHELFEADVINALEAVAFSGLVTNTNMATGIEETKIIMSVVASKNEFMAFDLSKIDPQKTFKHMKGVAAATLVDLTPIPPIIQIEKTDKRFVNAREVAPHLDDSINLAAMHWEDFEHLVRELFEKELSASGGEVNVTQASSDGGVDAIAFDPDPIRGGKIVIQAKRYTNVVGVAAVRDLYGTVMNEGATKGILVTTSDYGKDSYEFAKGKPLTLLNGSNLLSMLEKHGHKARINVSEAKKVLRG